MGEEGPRNMDFITTQSRASVEKTGRKGKSFIRTRIRCDWLTVEQVMC